MCQNCRPVNNAALSDSDLAFIQAQTGQTSARRYASSLRALRTETSNQPLPALNLTNPLIALQRIAILKAKARQ